MSRDYGKTKKAPAKRNHKNKSGGTIPGWVLFFSGVAVTLFAQLFFKLATTDSATAPTSTHNKPASTLSSSKPEARKPAITFHNTLKNMEVDVDSDDKTPVTQPATGVTPKPATTTEAEKAKIAEEKPAAKYNYYLQAGSFKTEQDAEEHRAKLSMLGIRTQLEVKKNSDGNNYYRIVTPTFTSASELEKARKMLNDAKVPSITLKR